MRAQAPRFRAVLFDLDGTLVDSTADLAAAVNHARAAAGFPPLPVAAIRAMIGDGMPALLARAVPEPALVARAIDAFRPYYAAHLLDATKVYDGVEDALAALAAAGVALAVVTNKPGRFSREILDRLGLARYFAAPGAIVGGDGPSGKKPEPGPFRAALAALGLPAAGPALVVGDGRNDVLGARAAGLPVCGVAWGIGDPAEIRALGPDYWVERPADLPGVAGVTST